MSRVGRCKNCEHSRLTQQMGVQALYCHRNPPAFQLMPGQGNANFIMAGMWPPVDADESCGEYESENNGQGLVETKAMQRRRE